MWPIELVFIINIYMIYIYEYHYKCIHAEYYLSLLKYANSIRDKARH